MQLEKIVDWLDKTLEVDAFDDVSNNGLQVAREGAEVKRVAFAVDASLKSVQEAIAAKAQLLVVHHGISWGGGIKRLTGGVYKVVKAAMEGNLAIYAVHLPLDANEKCGNNYMLARLLKLKKLRRAFNYHGNVIGVIGENDDGLTVGVCSGGAGAFAEEAKTLGCDMYVTGEADWGEKIAAENVGIRMVCAGHYDTETFGVAELSELMSKQLEVATKLLVFKECLINNRPILKEGTL